FERSKVYIRDLKESIEGTILRSETIQFHSTVNPVRKFALISYWHFLVVVSRIEQHFHYATLFNVALRRSPIFVFAGNYSMLKSHKHLLPLTHYFKNNFKLQG